MHKETVTTQMLLDIIAHTKSISQTLGDEIKALEENYKKYNFKEASRA